MRKTAFAVAALSLASLLSSGAWADDFKCSDATLQGEYAFGVTNLTTQSVAAGIKYFDGNGNMKQQDYRGNSNPTNPMFSPPGQETGTYQVNPDCTGKLTTGVASGNTVVVLFVISNGGRHIHEVVASLTTPAGNVPVQTSADDWKVAPAEDQNQQ